MSGPPSRDVARRTWDTEAFEARAAARRAAEADDSPSASAPRARKQPAVGDDKDDPHAPKRAWLRPRASLPDLEARVGDVSVVSSATGGTGFRCRACDVVLKDSNRFIAHINSRKHQKRLGVSMRVRRSTPDEVRAAFDAALKRRDRLAAAASRAPD